MSIDPIYQQFVRLNYYYFARYRWLEPLITSHEFVCSLAYKDDPERFLQKFEIPINVLHHFLIVFFRERSIGFSSLGLFFGLMVVGVLGSSLVFAAEKTAGISMRAREERRRQREDNSAWTTKEEMAWGERHRGAIATRDKFIGGQ